jgi:hypothetical protein
MEPKGLNIVEHRTAAVFAFVLIAGLGLQPGDARAEAGKNFAISRIACRNVTCQKAEGLQGGLTTIEVEGKGFSQLAGYSVRLTVVRRLGNEIQGVVDDRKVGIMTDGHFTTSLAVYKYEDGDYSFTFSPLKDPQNTLALGSFTKTTGGAAQGGARDAHASASDDLAGKWYGINGTAGLVRIHRDGMYTFNEERGQYRQNGNTIVFSGPLSVWNGGRATVGRGVIEFYWTNANGAKQYFVFAKDK